MKRLLVQLDGDRLPSSFDGIVAYDSGVHRVLSYGAVREQDVAPLVHGAIFTRGPKDLRNTALFIGGSDAALAERLLSEVQAAFFGPFRTSVMLDPNGSNTTAAAVTRKVVAALAGDVKDCRALVLAGTGPVGTRAAGLLGQLGANVRITSRDGSRGEAAAARIRDRFGTEPGVEVVRDPADLPLDGVQVLIAAGPAAARVAARAAWAGRAGLRVVADVNAVPPSGIEGVEPSDDGQERDGVRAYGALAIGRLKMKLHKACIARLFERNDQVLDAEAIYDLAADLLGANKGDGWV